MPFQFPLVYPILDASFIPPAGRQIFLLRLGASLADAGVTLLEYRNKTGTDQDVLADASILRAAMPPGQVKLVLDDRAGLVMRLGFDGVHVDAGDMSPADARALLGPDAIVGAFGGSENLVRGILAAPADYLAIGPVYSTTTKQTNKPPIGPAGVRSLREQAGPEPILVAAGGICSTTAPLVLAAGAGAVAVAAALFRHADPAGEFRRWMKVLG
jgi:thiamine-phosphate pyrophosphorylase